MIKQQMIPTLVVASSLLLLTACAGMTRPDVTVLTEEVEANATVPTETVASEASVTEAPPTEEMATEAVATESVVAEETTPEPVAESTDWTETATVDGDFYILGNPGAPIRLVDYSDFM